MMRGNTDLNRRSCNSCKRFSATSDARLSTNLALHSGHINEAVMLAIPVSSDSWLHKK